MDGMDSRKFQGFIKRNGLVGPGFVEPHSLGVTIEEIVSKDRIGFCRNRLNPDASEVPSYSLAKTYF